MPLLKARPGAIPEDHTDCGDTREACMSCLADEHLTPADWFVIRFYLFVQDQLVNLTPMGLEGGRVWLAPRLEAWAAACELLEVRASMRRLLIEQARALHEMIEDRVKVGSIHLMNPADLEPLEG